jgi:hypothetical protein
LIITSNYIMYFFIFQYPVCEYYDFFENLE